MEQQILAAGAVVVEMFRPQAALVALES